ncbi:MAG: DsrE family protein [Cyclobacteriaceae bacterium]
MKHFFLFLLLFSGISALAQKKSNLIIENFGTVYTIPDATILPDSSKKYQIVIDAKTGNKDFSELAFALYNTARMMNLHALGGVKPENLEVVLAIHGGATFAILDNESYQKKFGTDNPNIPLIKELKDAGVKITVCGQSLLGRKIKTEQVLPEVEIATSMLTTVSTYQLKGFAVFQF